MSLKHFKQTRSNQMVSLIEQLLKLERTTQEQTMHKRMTQIHHLRTLTFDLDDLTYIMEAYLILHTTHTYIPAKL
ncbi:hypothetical protein TsFJ059_003998 [Trichoderma semiorbis]|uniref:Uncharacterized protein n=1 Tax=Trichoderma semiorbis TaxID=1491008 RepID=A0A9P8HJX0_9HYPO|nr:hypothetical protein TsFJ059_003998 [Trichoderma semiorbis]